MMKLKQPEDQQRPFLPPPPTAVFLLLLWCEDRHFTCQVVCELRLSEMLVGFQPLQ